MYDIVKIHEKIFRFLLSWRSKHEGFTFILRKSDLKKRLSLGYWFHGNDDYIALSFWTGMDWQRRIPNICFIIKPEKGETYLQFSAKDSVEKNNLIHSVFDPVFQLDHFGDALYFKTTPFAQSNDYMNALLRFLERDKIVIDNLIQTNTKLFETKQNKQNRIGLIANDDFNAQLTRVLQRRKKSGTDNLPISVSSIAIEDFGPIKQLALDNIEKDVQWIFLTGENGTGKTSILKAIAVALTNGSLAINSGTPTTPDYSLKLMLNKNGRNPKFRVKRKTTPAYRPIEILTKGFVAFGPIRINITEESRPRKEKLGTIEKALSRPHLSLFNTTSYLIDIGTIYNLEQATANAKKFFGERFYFIIQAITAICPPIVDIHFKQSMKYFELDSNKQPLNSGGTSFRHLASGYKSLIGLISHMMLHLYYQQPEIQDPSELEGVVIIDEIDLHFHPKMQKDLVTSLSELFPRIQFIVSTHSPIPLLGAPRNSLVYTVKRNVADGVYVEKMSDKVPFENMLPNAILTSPIFGLTNIIPNSIDPEQPLRVGDSFDDIQLHERLEQDLDNFLTNKEQKRLQGLFSTNKHEKDS